MISTTAESTFGGGRNCSFPMRITMRTVEESNCVLTERRQYALVPAEMKHRMVVLLLCSRMNLRRKESEHTQQPPY